MTTKETLLWTAAGGAVVLFALVALKPHHKAEPAKVIVATIGPPPKPTVYIPAAGDDWSVVAHRLNINPSKAMTLKTPIAQRQPIPLPLGYIDHGPEKQAMGKLQ